MKNAIRRKPQLQNSEERMANAAERYDDQGPVLLEKLHQDILDLRAMISEKGLDRSNGKAESLVNALR